MDVQYIVQRGIGKVSVRLYHTQEWATLQNKNEQLSWFNLRSQLSPTQPVAHSPQVGSGRELEREKNSRVEIRTV